MFQALSFDDSTSPTGGRFANPRFGGNNAVPPRFSEEAGTARIRLSAFNTLNTHDWQRLRFTIHPQNKQRRLRDLPFTKTG